MKDARQRPEAQARRRRSVPAPNPEIALLGVRHHGPGSARAVGAALAQFRPEVVLIEGPPEADALLPLAAGKEMTPPVALLAHVVDEPARAAFWPFAAFSPEWVALRHALDEGIPVRFIDLPAAHTFALTEAAERAQQPAVPAPGEDGNGPEGDGGHHGDGHHGDGHHDDGGDHQGEAAPGARLDPIAELARAAGQEDAERWWEDVVEHARPGGGEEDALAPFHALAEAMAALRERNPEALPEDARREAFMRRQLRAAVREGHRRIAVVCGAWHVPALAAKASVAADNELLRGLPKAKVELTWVPWTHRRLAQRTGYGAGIVSPGWYQHLFEADGRLVVERWMTRVATLLRAEDHPVSSAHVIEAVRLAETLAALRGRPLAGLAETLDAAQAVLCEGSEVPLRLVEEQLVVGDALGQVPEAAPAVPLQRDLSRLQRELRLKPEARVRALELDLRKELDAERSRLLHRLALLGIDWARPAASQVRATGTFRESWELSWEPELAVRVAEAGVWGTTVVAAASARVAAQAVAARQLGEVTVLAESCLLAALPEALPVVLRCLADRAALDSDVAHLAEALPALVRSLRYGDVRATDSALLGDLATSLATRICIGLPSAASSLDVAAAQALAEHVAATHAAIALLSTTGRSPDPAPDAAVGADRDTVADTGMDTGTHPGADPDAAPGTAGKPSAAGPADAGAAVQQRWIVCLRSLVERESAAGTVRGRATRLLLDDGRLAEGEAERLLGLVLTPGVPPAEGAAWVDGFLAGSGVLLVHDERLLALLDTWIGAIPAALFPDVLPLLRRTFARLEAGVRRSVGELVRDGGRDRPEQGARPGFAAQLDVARAAPALTVVRLILEGKAER